jgi:VanZ family protein
LYGIFIEIMQYYIFVRRSAEISDMISDAVGCLVGYLVIKVVYGNTINSKFRV